MNKEIIKSANKFYKEYKIKTHIENNKIYVNVNNEYLELSQEEIIFRSKCNNKYEEYKEFVKNPKL
tara:strand:+ start:78 stop:275 length:198 start_codon:yes stop_codon:yes gene_type:complete